MTAVGGTRTSASSSGVTLADLPIGRVAPSTSDGEFGVLFARTLDLADARPERGDSGVIERSESARRDAERMVRDDDAPMSSARSATDDDWTVRDSATNRTGVAETADGGAGATREGDDDSREAALVDARLVAVPSATVVRTEPVRRGDPVPFGQPGSAVATPMASTPVSNGAEVAGGAVPADAAPSPSPAGTVLGAPGVPVDAVALAAGGAQVSAAAVPQAATLSPSDPSEAAIARPGGLEVSEEAASPAAPTGGPEATMADAVSPTAAASTTTPTPDTGSIDAVGIDASAVDASNVDAAEVPVEGVLDIAASQAGEPARDTDDTPVTTSRIDGRQPTVSAVGGDAPGRPTASPAGATGMEGADTAPADSTQRLEDLRRVRERAALGGLTDSTMSVDLSDEGLGQLTLHALQRNGGVHLTLSAAEQTTRDLLLRQGEQLRSDLEAGGVSLGSLDIQQSDARAAGGRDGGNRGEPTRRRNDLAAHSSSPTVAATAPPLRSRPSTDGLDLLI